MRRSSRLLLAAATFVLLAPSARAADVPVVYTVDTTALKLAISGTNLTFQLYTDAACTSLAHTQVLTVDNVSMLSVLKRSKPKNGLKPPKTTDIRATLTGVAPAAPLYAKVTGTGITPVGGACQVQASTAAGPSSGPVVVKDSNGAVLGPMDNNGNFVLSDGGNLILSYAPPAGFYQGVSFFYTSTNCSGPALVFTNPVANGYLHQHMGVDGTTLYYAALSAPNVLVSSQDYSPEIPANCVAPGQVFNPPNRCCCTGPTCFPTPFMIPAAPPSTMDISGFVPPFSASIP